MSQMHLDARGLVAERSDLESKAVEEQYNRLTSALDTLESRVQEIQSDPGLTPDGAEERIRAYLEEGAGKKVLESVLGGGKAEQMISAVDERREQLTSTELLLKDDASDNPRTLAAEQEFRSYLRGLDVNERRSVLQRAADADDRTKLRAVALDPLRGAADPIVPDDEWAEIVERHSRVRFSEAWSKLEERSREASALEFNLEQAQEAAEKITRRALTPEPEPVHVG